MGGKSALSKSHIVPGQIMDVISCSCGAVGKACSKNGSSVANALYCTIPATVYVKAVVILSIP